MYDNSTLRFKFLADSFTILASSIMLKVSVNWLKPIYHKELLYTCGAYLSSYGEIRTIEEFYRRGEISKEQIKCIYEEIYVNMTIGMKCEIKSIMKRIYPDYYLIM